MIRALLLLALTACASKSWLDRSIPQGPIDHIEDPRAEIDQVPVLGHRVVVFSRGGERVRGELLAVDTRYLSVQPEIGALVHVPVEQAASVRVVVRPRNAHFLVPWGIVGTVSTLTHGFALVLTAPTWMAMTAGFSVSSYAGGTLKVYSGDYDKLYQFSRFPAGLPFAFLATVPPYLRDEDRVAPPR